mmetsp:Transcript_8439/g.17085  ORF Transcript_8439/g.17085 Transcript_8439/m.17085 type:complete len:284 (-) Transcript_8439:729-1580(-)
MLMRAKAAKIPPCHAPRSARPPSCMSAFCSWCPCPRDTALHKVWTNLACPKTSLASTRAPPTSAASRTARVRTSLSCPSTACLLVSSTSLATSARSLWISPTGSPPLRPSLELRTRATFSVAWFGSPSLLRSRQPSALLATHSTLTSLRAMRDLVSCPPLQPSPSWVSQAASSSSRSSPWPSSPPAQPSVWPSARSLPTISTRLISTPMLTARKLRWLHTSVSASGLSAWPSFPSSSRRPASASAGSTTSWPLYSVRLYPLLLPRSTRLCSTRPLPSPPRLLA